ncbi:MAG: hypothetical protein QOF89_3571 [Acidobacteriota bacterium]|nr:hypothetical protein [Acidobacteriota bacterium]
MNRPSHTIAMLALVSSLAIVGAYPVNAGCVSCGPGGECFDVTSGFSGNCECRIRNVQGVAVCKPSGVCDPSDATSCDSSPQPNVSPGVEVSAKFLSRLAEKSPRLAGAVWGALMEDSSSREVLRYRLVAGEYTGTLGKAGKSYTFRTRVQALSGDAFSLSVLVEEDGTGRAEEFTGALLDRGQSGTLERVGREGRTRVFSWSTREPEK